MNYSTFGWMILLLAVLFALYVIASVIRVCVYICDVRSPSALGNQCAAAKLQSDAGE